MVIAGVAMLIIALAAVAMVVIVDRRSARDDDASSEIDANTKEGPGGGYARRLREFVHAPLAAAH